MRQHPYCGKTRKEWERGGTIRLIQSDDLIMHVLRAVQLLRLPDWCVCAGFIRSKVWDHLRGFTRTHLPDVDVVYFDRNHTDESVNYFLNQAHPFIYLFPNGLPKPKPIITFASPQAQSVYFLAFSTAWPPNSLRKGVIYGRNSFDGR